MPVIYYLWNWTERPDSDIVSSSIFFNLASGLARNIIAPLSHCQDETDPSLDWIFESWWDQENIESRSTFSNALYNSAWWSKGAASSNTVLLALALPDKNAATEICYVCGNNFKRGSLKNVNTWPNGREPYFHSLLACTRPPGSRPLDSAGRVQSCERCRTFLLNQWKNS